MNSNLTTKILLKELNKDEVKEYTRLSVELTKAKAKVMLLEAKRNAIENAWSARLIKQNNGEK